VLPREGREGPPTGAGGSKKHFHKLLRAKGPKGQSFQRQETLHCKVVTLVLLESSFHAPHLPSPTAAGSSLSRKRKRAGMKEEGGRESSQQVWLPLGRAALQGCGVLFS
jgi:hypothetical protein